MTDEEWQANAAAIADKQQRLRGSSFETIRIALTQVYGLLHDAGARPDELYCMYPEAELVDAANSAFAALAGGDWAWSLDEKGLEGIVRSAAARLRALDRLLMHNSPHHGPPGDADVEYLCATTGWYVIPRLTARAARPGHGSRSTLLQRGTLNHRLVPQRINSYHVRLHWLGDIAPVMSHRQWGAAMFEDFDLEHRKIGPRFKVTGVTILDAAATITQAVLAANNAECACLAWPELTMRPDVEGAMLKQALEDLATSDAEGGYPAFTLAGSWHVGSDEELANVAPVLDFSGTEIFSHTKARAYADNDLGMEAIYPDYQVPLLVTQNEIVAFAICKDFCDLRKGIP